MTAALSGLGLYFQFICRNNTSRCPSIPSKRWCDLTPYEHLKHIFRLCYVHFWRNVKELKPVVPRDVLSAMYSLASSQQHADIERALNAIRNGGEKAKGKSANTQHKVHSSRIIQRGFMTKLFRVHSLYPHCISHTAIFRLKYGVHALILQMATNNHIVTSIEMVEVLV